MESEDKIIYKMGSSQAIHPFLPPWGHKNGRIYAYILYLL